MGFGDFISDSKQNLLQRVAVQVRKSLPSSRRSMLSPSSLQYNDSPTLEMEKSYFSEVCHILY